MRTIREPRRTAYPGGDTSPFRVCTASKNIRHSYHCRQWLVHHKAPAEINRIPPARGAGAWKLVSACWASSLSYGLCGGWMTETGSEAGKCSSRPRSSVSSSASFGALAASRRAYACRHRSFSSRSKLGIVGGSERFLFHSSIWPSFCRLRADFPRDAGVDNDPRRPGRSSACTAPRFSRLCAIKDGRRAGKRRHEDHDLHRGPAADLSPQGAARLRRLLRIRAPTPSRRCGPIAPISSASSCASASCTMSPTAAPRPRSSASRRRLPLALAPVGPDRHAARRRRNSRLPRRAGRGHSVHAVDHVDLLDRGRRRRGRQAVLVPALRHEGPRLYPRADRARRRGQMQCAGAHGRSSGDRPAPSRHQERHDRAAGDPHQEPDRHRDQAGLGAGRAAAASARPSATSPATIPA